MNAAESRTLDAGLVIAGTVRALTFAVLGCCGAIRFACVEPISLGLALACGVVAMVGSVAVCGGIVGLFSRN